ETNRLRPVRPDAGRSGPDAELAARDCFATQSILTASEVGEAALGHRLDAFFEILGAAQPVLLDELALGGSFDGIAQAAAHRLARRHHGERPRSCHPRC